MTDDAARPPDGADRSISDPTAIRALAHPTRLALLDILTGEGQATATRCAQLSGQSVASCSFHLRTLARHGFIEAVPGPGREKPWRLTSLRQRIGRDGDEEVRAAGAAFEEFFLGHEFDRIRAWLRHRDEEPAAWRDASVLGGATLWLTAPELAEIAAEVNAVIQARVDRVPADRVRADRAADDRAADDRAAERRPVRLFVATSVGLYDPGTG